MELMLAAVTTGIILVLEIVLWRSKANAFVRLSAGLFGLAVIVYVLCTTKLIGSWVGEVVWLRVPIAAFVSADVALYAMLVTAVFDDKQVTWKNFVSPIGFAFLGHTVLNTTGETQAVLLAVFLLGCAFLLITSIVNLLGGRPGDLVETRKSLRQPVVVATALIGIAIVADIVVSTAARVGLVDSWLALQREAAITLVTIYVASQLLTARPPLEVQSRGRESGGEHYDNQILASLTAAMNEGELWRREGLTIRALSDELDVPEYRLRRIIVERLGFRNFPAFINSKRVEAAKIQMAQSAFTTIAASAYDVGFSSLSAFNRAFREYEGESPTVWRRRHVSKQ